LQNYLSPSIQEAPENNVDESSNSHETENDDVVPPEIAVHGINVKFSTFIFCKAYI
jgi:hypothetical protein